jgi:hypothetical protein
MAKKVSVELVDDIDGTVIADGSGSTVTFSLERKSYEIDLSDANLQKLQKALEPFISASRPVSAGNGRASTSRSRSNRGTDLNAVRAWARENGHTVSDRGRVPASVLEAYVAAN